MRVDISDLEYIRNKLLTIKREARYLQRKVIELVTYATHNKESLLSSTAAIIERSLCNIEDEAEDALDTLDAIEAQQEGDEE